MSGTRGAGALDQRFAFDKRGQSSDGAGGVLTAYTQQFVVWAGLFHQRGGENVIAGRLQGVHTVIVRVRRSPQSLQINSDWRARDAKLGTIYAIRDVTPSEDRMYLDFLCESGVAT